jgi:hypothetical protein
MAELFDHDRAGLSRTRLDCGVLNSQSRPDRMSLHRPDRRSWRASLSPRVFDGRDTEARTGSGMPASKGGLRNDLAGQGVGRQVAKSGKACGQMVGGVRVAARFRSNVGPFIQKRAARS